MATMEFLTTEKEPFCKGSCCKLHRAVALLSLGLGHPMDGDGVTDEVRELLQKAEGLLREGMQNEGNEKSQISEDLENQNELDFSLKGLSGWPSKILHQMSRKLRHLQLEESDRRKREKKLDPKEERKHSKKKMDTWNTEWFQAEKEESGESGESGALEDCLILIYTFPTEEIRQDAREALGSLEEFLVNPIRKMNEKLPKMVVFIDENSEEELHKDLRPYTSLDIWPAIIPQEELVREMNSYSCQNGFLCASGEELPVDFHRGNVNETQFWSPAYLRISRYTAGPLFLHPVLDSCGHFLKIDTDFFFTEQTKPFRNPFTKMRREGVRLGYWQMHLQGQRQSGYMEAALRFLQEQTVRGC